MTGNSMNEPLTTWCCDVCGQWIEDVEQGYVIWKTGDGLKDRSFKIIHKSRCNLKDHRASAALRDFLGSNGLAYLLSKLSVGPIRKKIGGESYCSIADLDEFVDLIRRVQTPFYEEARRKFGKGEILEDHSTNNEALPYFPEQLMKIANQYDEDR